MRRIIAILGGTASLAVALAGTAHGALPRDGLRDFQCQRALEPAARAVSLTSVMRPVSGTQSMAVRFGLFVQTTGATRYAPVSGSDLGRWISPSDRTLGRRPGDVWLLKKPVVDLPAPAAYRFRVNFRWTGAHHRVLATATRTSPVCRQPELRPDLAVRKVATPQPTPTGKADLYAVTVANNGVAAAGPFTIALTTPSGKTVSVSVPGLGARRRTTRTLRAPLCSAGAPTITVDPQGQVEDFDRANNVLTVASCSAPTTAP